MGKRIHLALTFDVEQWDPHPRDLAYDALIDALGSTATTWFLAEDRTQSVADRYPRIVERLLAQGHEIGAHVHFQRAAFAEMAGDVRAATGRLRSAGASCVGFRGGGHVFTDQLADEIVALGYRYDSSAVPGLIRRHHTHDGDTFAAYPHVWSARPFWWRPGLLELPTACFPLARPLAFVRKRFRLPLLVDRPAVFRARLFELAAVHPAPDVPVVVLGHGSDVERDGRPDRTRLTSLARSLEELRADPSIRMCALATLGGEIASGTLAAGLRRAPPAIVSAAAVRFTGAATRVAEHPWLDRLVRRLGARS